MHSEILDPKQSHPQTKTSFCSKIALILFGVCLTVIIIESALRIGEFLILSLQEYGNINSISQKGSYRILCLGESTTQGQYPHFLEEILNQSNIGIRFSVIDKGKAATNTTIILKQLELYLDKYRPDMIVAMMGVNDGGAHMPYENPGSSKITLFFKSFKTYKLIRLLWLHITTKAKETGLFNFRLKEVFAQIENTPDNDVAYLDLGLSYQNRGELQQAEQCFKKALELNPKNEEAYLKLAMLYKDQSELQQAEQCFKKALELNPKNEGAYLELRWLCAGSEQVEGYLNKALELNPKNDGAYVELGLSYRDRGQYQLAEESLQKALELNPKKERIYLDLGWLYLMQHKFLLAEQCFKKGLVSCQDKTKLNAALAVLYREMGKISIAPEYAYKAEGLKFGYFDPETAQNYRKLKQVLDKRNIKLVCVQYPLRNIESLKRIFGDDSQGIIFVDNALSFREAVREGGYALYFKDIFGGDFGHCTDKGNSLLALNIAKAILRGVFRK